MKDWLKKRLTPRKRLEDRWTSLAECIQALWEEYFDPSLQRLENLRSYFRAHDDDLAKKLREMGDYFAADMPRTKDKPIAVAWRKLELEYKDLELILSSVFRRHYADLPVTWFPLFAPVDEAYGSQFLASEGPWPERKNIPPEGWFLTSRGRLGTDFGHLLSIGLNKEEYMKKALPLLLRTKPLHIVLGGFLWYIRFDTPFEYTGNCLWERENYGYELQFSVLGSRFDFTPADAAILDVQTALCAWERESYFDVVHSFPKDHVYWRLDQYLPEGLPEAWLPLDTIIAGNEADGKNPFRLVATIREETPVILAPLVTGFIRKKELEIFPRIKFRSRLVRGAVIDNFYEMTAFPRRQIWHLDRYLPSGFPENWLPRDTIITGNEADGANPCALVALVREVTQPIKTPIEVSNYRERAIFCQGAEFEAEPVQTGIVERPCPIDVPLYQPRLDHYPNFDECPADFAPLDMPVGGYVYA